MHSIERALATQHEESLQDLFQRARAAKGMTQEDLALEIGAARPSWTLFETKGTLNVSMEKVLEACRILDVDEYWVCYKLGRIHPEMERVILSGWELYDGLRDALGL